MTRRSWRWLQEGNGIGTQFHLSGIWNKIQSRIKGLDEMEKIWRGISEKGLQYWERDRLEGRLIIWGPRKEPILIRWESICWWLIKIRLRRRKGNPPTLLVGMQTDVTTMENNMEVPQETKSRATIWPYNLTADYISGEKCGPKGYIHPNVHYSAVYNSHANTCNQLVVKISHYLLLGIHYVS